MAGFGHAAVGLVAGRLHKENVGYQRGTMLWLFPLLSFLPDFDLLGVWLGVADEGWAGHRGASHAPFTALVVGLVAGALARRLKAPAGRTALAVALAVATHGVLDALAQDGRGIMFLWPFSDERFHLPWRPIPDAPRGIEFFSRKGLYGLTIELLYFAPFVTYALWPRRRRRDALAPSAARYA